jgi:3',5'-cyclic AMP phosphodiesterase CpdA
MRFFFNLFLTLSVFIVGCDSKTPKTSNFQHDISNGPKPWVNEIDKKTTNDFTFGIISDLNGGEREGVFNVAVQQFNRINPEFVLSIGDLIDGGTEDFEQLEIEWDDFDNRASKFNMPFFYLGGNHDLTNPRMREFWKKRFGPRYYHFVYNDVLFLMVDSEDFEEKRMQEVYLARAEALQIIKGEIEGEYTETEYYNMLERRTGAMSDAQFKYFDKILKKYSNVNWTFILMHKPLWQRKDDKGLARLEKLLINRPFTVINGHLHSFSHRIRNNRDYIILGTTGGSQNAKDSSAFDHVTLVRMSDKKPVITHLRMDGILDETGRIPIGGDTLSFQASK